MKTVKILPRSVYGVIALCMLFIVVAIHARRSGEGLGLVVLKIESQTPLSGLHVVSRSPWGSEWEYVEGSGGWFRPRDNVRRWVASIFVTRVEREAECNCYYAILQSWGEQPRWHKAVVRFEGGLAEVVMPHAQQSMVFKKSGTPANWLGDGYFVRMTLRRTMLIGIVCWAGFALVGYTLRDEGKPCPNLPVRDYLFAVFFLGVFASCGLVFSHRGWPGLHWDACLYATVPVNLATLNRNEFDVYVNQLVLRNHLPVSEVHRFDSHGQLYGWLFGLLMKSSTGSFVEKSLMIAALGACVTSLYTLYVSRKEKHLVFFPRFLCSLFTGLSCLAVSIHLQGRPESLLPLLLVPLSYLRDRANRLGVMLADGLLIGVCSLASPFCGAVYGVFRGGRLLVGGSSLVDVVLVAVSSFLMWAGLGWLLSDVSPVELLKNITPGGGEYAVGSLNSADWVGRLSWSLKSAWLGEPMVPGIGLIFLATCICFAWQFVQSVKARRDWWGRLFIVIGVLISGTLACSLLFVGTRFYNVIWAIGPAVWYSFSVLFNRTDQDSTVPMPVWLKSVAASSLLLGLLLPSLRVVHLFLLALSMTGGSVSLEAAKLKWSALKASLTSKEMICIDSHNVERSAVVLDGPPWRARAISPLPEFMHLGRAEQLGEVWSYYVVLQESVDPPQRAGFELIETTFNDRPVVFLGFVLSEFTPGYGLAIYRRVSSNGRF